MKHKFLFSVFVIFFILVFIALGSWQIIRLNWKNNLILEIENSLKNSPVELNQSKQENYLKEITNSIHKKKDKFQGINFDCCSYDEWEPHNMLIYCDPPWDYGGKMQFDKSGKKDLNSNWEKNIFISVDKHFWQKLSKTFNEVILLDFFSEGNRVGFDFKVFELIEFPNNRILISGGLLTKDIKIARKMNLAGVSLDNFALHREFLINRLR